MPSIRNKDNRRNRQNAIFELPLGDKAYLDAAEPQSHIRFNRAGVIRLAFIDRCACIMQNLNLHRSLLEGCYLICSSVKVEIHQTSSSRAGGTVHDASGEVIQSVECTLPDPDCGRALAMDRFLPESRSHLRTRNISDLFVAYRMVL